MEFWREEHSFSTGIKEEYPKRLSYKWTIQNFHRYNNVNEFSTGISIHSPMFQSSNYKHRLLVYPNGFEDPDFVSIMVDFCTDNSFTDESDIEFYILDNAMKPINKKKGTLFYDRNFMCRHFISKDDLYNNYNELLNNNELTVVCSFVKYELIDNAPNIIDTELQKRRSKFSLCSDLQKLLQNKSLTDVTLVANDNKLQAHKLVLVARSPVFAAMLQNDMEEKIKSEIVIKDFSANILSEMLQFLYTEKVTNIKENFQDLLSLANKYDIEGLKLLCEEFMLDELTIDNVIDVFILAESQNCSVLRPKVLKFVMKSAPMIVQSPQYESRKKDLPSWLIDILKAAA